MNTGRMTFLLAFLPTVANQLTNFISGNFDDMTTRKLIASFILCMIFATVNGLFAVKTLYTEPAPKLAPPPAPVA